jgi:hypothetical protein
MVITSAFSAAFAVTRGMHVEAERVLGGLGKAPGFRHLDRRLATLRLLRGVCPRSRIEKR